MSEPMTDKFENTSVNFEQLPEAFQHAMQARLQAGVESAKGPVR